MYALKFIKLNGSAHIRAYDVYKFDGSFWEYCGMTTKDPVLGYWLCSQNGYSSIKRAGSKEHAGQMLAEGL